MGQELHCSNPSRAHIRVAKSIVFCAVYFRTFHFSIVEDIISKKSFVLAMKWLKHCPIGVKEQSLTLASFSLWKIFHLFTYCVFVMSRWPSYILG